MYVRNNVVICVCTCAFASVSNNVPANVCIHTCDVCVNVLLLPASLSEHWIGLESIHRHFTLLSFVPLGDCSCFAQSYKHCLLCECMCVCALLACMCVLLDCMYVCACVLEDTL